MINKIILFIMEICSVLKIAMMKKIHEVKLQKTKHPRLQQNEIYPIIFF